jgi:hypothetical protein
MAVSLTVTTEDAALEDLLRYLDTHGDHPHTSSKLWLIEKAAKWLKASLYVHYDEPSDEITIKLSPGGDASDTPRSPHSLLSQ